MAEPATTTAEQVKQSVRDQVGRAHARLQGGVRETLQDQARSENDVAENPSPQPDVPPESSPETEDRSPESSPGAEQPKDSDKEINFKRLREERDRERRLRENMELELADMRRKEREAVAKEQNDRRLKDLWLQLQSDKPEGFDEWDEDKKMAWTARQAIAKELDKDFGISKDVRNIRDENKILRKFPSLDDDQVEKVLEIYQGAAGFLNEAEAYQTAMNRHPELFPSDAQPSASGGGVVPPSHQVMEPSREGAHRAPPDEGKEVNENVLAAFSASPAHMSSAKKRAMIDKMKHRFGQLGLLP